MGAYIARQPNGLLCRFSSVVDAVTHYNYSEEEYIELCAEKAREEARRNLQDPHFIKPFDRVVDDVRFDNITYEEWVKQAGEMGYTEPDWKFKPGDWVIVHSHKDNILFLFGEFVGKLQAKYDYTHKEIIETIEDFYAIKKNPQ